MNDELNNLSYLRSFGGWAVGRLTGNPLDWPAISLCDRVQLVLDAASRHSTNVRTAPCIYFGSAMLLRAQQMVEHWPAVLIALNSVLPNTQIQIVYDRARPQTWSLLTGELISESIPLPPEEHLGVLPAEVAANISAISTAARSGIDWDVETAALQAEVAALRASQPSPPMTSLYRSRYSAGGGPGRPAAAQVPYIPPAAEEAAPVSSLLPRRRLRRLQTLKEKS